MIRDILDSPLIYRLWQAPFARQKFEPVRLHGLPEPGSRVLDVGCGPGTNAGFFTDVEYFGVDLDPAYIEYATRRHNGRFLVRDVTEGLDDLGQFDFVLMNSLMHHLDDDEAGRLLDALGGVLASGGILHVLDLVLPRERSTARTLARMDRGAHPRHYEDWRDLISRWFSIDSHAPYAVKFGGLQLWRMVHVVCRDRSGGSP